MTEPEPVIPANRTVQHMAGDSLPRGPWGDVSFRMVDDDEDEQDQEVSPRARAGAVQEA